MSSILIHGVLQELDKDEIIIIFENESGDDVIHVDLDENSKKYESAIVYFKEKETAEKIAEKEIVQTEHWKFRIKLSNRVYDEKSISLDNKINNHQKVNDDKSMSRHNKINNPYSTEAVSINPDSHLHSGFDELNTHLSNLETNLHSDSAQFINQNRNLITHSTQPNTSISTADNFLEYQNQPDANVSSNQDRDVEDMELDAWVIYDNSEKNSKPKDSDKVENKYRDHGCVDSVRVTESEMHGFTRTLVITDTKLKALHKETLLSKLSYHKNLPSGCCLKRINKNEFALSCNDGSLIDKLYHDFSTMISNYYSETDLDLSTRIASQINTDYGKKWVNEVLRKNKVIGLLEPSKPKIIGFHESETKRGVDCINEALLTATISNCYISNVREFYKVDIEKNKQGIIQVRGLPRDVIEATFKIRFHILFL